MTLVRGSWYNEPNRPMVKASEDAEQGDFAACAITCSAIAAGHVISEKASDGLRRRSYTAFVDKKAASSSEGWSSTYVLWQPSIKVNLLGVALFNIGDYENATCDNLTFYKNASSSFGQFALKSISTGIAAGTRTDMSLSACQTILADTPVTVKVNGSTCSAGGRATVTFEYETSN